MINKFGLSILIPTYKRPKKLRDLVENVVIPVANKYKLEIEIFIRDNTGIKKIKKPLDKEIRLPENVNYLVKADETANGFWTIHTWDGTEFTRTKIQSYNTSKYWESQQK